ncbi:MAG: hypothetical protein LUD47_05580 [Clostridia bacterium]|nr:hypothetical protein [Clostridia bacterium]
MKDLTVKFDLSDDRYITAVRLVAGAVCTLAETDIEAMDDFKVCVTESLIMLKNCGNRETEIKFSCEGGVSAEVTGLGGQLHEGDTDMSATLISALLSGVDIVKTGDAVTKLVLRL